MKALERQPTETPRRERSAAGILVVLVVLAGAVGASAPDSSDSPRSRLAATTITFAAAGSDTSLLEQAPRQQSVLSARFDVTGLPLPASAGGSTYTFASPNGHRAWKGDDGPGSAATARTPADFRNTLLTDTEESNLTANDDTFQSDRFATVPQGPQGATGYASAYHHFEYTVSPLSVVDRIDATWRGYGSGAVGGTNVTGAYLWAYDHAAGRWTSLGSHAGSSEGAVTGSNTTNAGDYVSAGNKVDILVSGPAIQTLGGAFDGDFSQVDTDYIEVRLNGQPEGTYPSAVTLDVGDDGDVEWSTGPGPYAATSTVDFSVELQRLIDAAGPGNGPVPVPFNFTSGTAGKLDITNVSITYGPPLPPSFSPFPELALDEDTSGAGLLDLQRVVSDPDSPVETLSFALVSQSDPSHLTAQLSTDGHTLGFTAAADWWGSATFTVSASDPGGLTATGAPFTVTVRSVNDRPVLEEPTWSAVEGQPFRGEIRASDVDRVLDPGAPLTYAAATDLFTVDPATGNFTFTPTQEHVGEHRIPVSVTDGIESDTSLGTLLVLEANNPPAIISDTFLEAYEDRPFTLEVQVVDPDLSVDPLEEILFADNTPLFDLDPGTGAAVFTPRQDQVGTTAFDVTVTDRAGASDTERFTLQIRNVNDPPTLGAIANQTIEAVRTTDLPFAASDEDIGYDPDEHLRFATTRTWATVDGAGGSLRFSPGIGDLGDHVLTLTVTDRVGLDASTTFTIHVVPPGSLPRENQPPVASIDIVDPKNRYRQGTSITFRANASDPDGDPLNFTWMVGGRVVGYGPELTTATLPAGKRTVTLVVTDLRATVTAERVVAITAQENTLPGFEGQSVLVATMGVAALVAFFRGGRRGGGG